MRENKDSSRMTILVADDREYNRNLVRARLSTAAEYDVIEASDGRQAIEMIERHRPDILLTDWLMPQIDGLRLCMMVREMNLQEYIYIILLTGKESQEDVVAGLEAGADDYMIKPFQKSELLARLRTASRIIKSQRSLRRLNEIKNRFLGIAAHDLRSPLTTVRGFADVLLGDAANLTDIQREYLTMIRNATQGMVTLVSDLLDISVIESGKLTLGIRRASLASVIEDRIKISRVHAKKKDISLCVRLEDPAHSEGYFDPDRIGQVMDNLVGNAVKFSMPGSTIFIVMVKDESSFRVSVIDEGPGISSEDQSRLFGTFQKLSAQPTAGERSTGLGLAIVKKIIDAHNGSIWVDSQVDVGSIFSFTIPVQQDGSIPEKRPMRVKALVADRKRHLRELYAMILSSMNAHVIGKAGDAGELMRFYSNHAPHVLVLDAGMPGEDGAEAFRELPARFPEAFVLLTGDFPQDEEDARRYMDSGAASLISTNATVSQIKRSIRMAWKAGLRR